MKSVKDPFINDALSIHGVPLFVINCCTSKKSYNNYYCLFYLYNIHPFYSIE